MSNGNIPAFPIIEESKSEQYDGATHITGTAVSFGLTKREMFAMAAMQGLLSSLAEGENPSCAEVASCAVAAADALLAELERTK